MTIFEAKTIFGVKVEHRQTDRQTNSFTPYTGVCGFFSVKFVSFLLAWLIGDIDLIPFNDSG